jgi:hypothetical protein
LGDNLVVFCNFSVCELWPNNNVNKDTEKIYTIIKPMDNSEEDEDIV